MSNLLLKTYSSSFKNCKTLSPLLPSAAEELCLYYGKGNHNKQFRWLTCPEKLYLRAAVNASLGNKVTVCEMQKVKTFSKHKNVFTYH